MCACVCKSTLFVKISLIQVKRNSANSRFHDKGTQEYQRPDQCPAYLPFVLFRRYRVGREKGERDIKGGTGIERRREDLAHLHTSPDSPTSEVGGLRQPKEDPFTTKPRHQSETFNMQFPTELWEEVQRSAKCRRKWEKQGWTKVETTGSVAPWQYYK
ncbi:hypothetical protein NPIL_264391 [Nephila pilipes]|uniref:Uncharacterized protein n=1 Tax=Nephila pilipes TaxID=299642 RepID=A0A8X6Q7Z0_NEPPI|nr:hypothetical protein NPIL_264391 [Nephila pilipes]